MNYEQAIAELEAEWSPEAGFFWRIRNGDFNAEGFERTLKILGSLHFDETSHIPRRIVSLLWYIPIFMQWQIERAQINGGDINKYSLAADTLHTHIEHLLGIP